MILKLQEMFREFEAKGLKVEEDPTDPLTLLVLVPDKDLLEFDFDEAVIRPQGLEFLRQFTPRLSETVCSGEFKTEINSIIVEGHADSRGTVKANLERSQQRSSAVLIEGLDILQRLEATEPNRPRTQDCFRKLLSATGRGSEDPILGPDGAEDKDRSRRVIFKIRIRSLEERQLQEIVGARTADMSR